MSTPAERLRETLSKVGLVAQATRDAAALARQAVEDRAAPDASGQEVTGNGGSSARP